MDAIETRKRIQNAGNELYERLGKTSRNLQYLAGEIMYGNENHIRKAQTTNCLFTVGDYAILKQGFTDNQVIFLTELEKEIRFYRDTLCKIEDRLLMMDADGQVD